MSAPASHDDGVVIVGAGGHGRELFDAARASMRVRGFVDDSTDSTDLAERVGRLGVPLLGDLTWLEENPGRYALGIGTSHARRELAARLDTGGCTAMGVVHPGATVGSDVRLGHAVVIYDCCTVTTNVDIGQHTHLNVGCAVQHDSVIGEFVQLSPGVFINGDCVIGDDVFLGTGAIVTRGCTIGAGARVGSGAVVLSDVAPGETVFGTPAAPHPR